MANKKQSTAELIGISHFSRNGLMTKRYGEVVYFIVQPTITKAKLIYLSSLTEKHDEENFYERLAECFLIVL